MPRFRAILDTMPAYRAGKAVVSSDGRSYKLSSNESPYEPLPSVVEAVARAAEGLDLSPVEVALAWVRDRPGVTAPIVGARTAAQLKGSLGVEDCTLPPEIVAALDDVSAS
jgi:aryl-alcohol dehydrogenase-like predicted oxidoreductase